MDRQEQGLSGLFYARSVAIVGASNNPRKASYQIISTMLHEGYTGTIHAVNPSQTEILGLPCYSSPLEIQDRVDLMVVSVPAEHVYAAVQDAASRGDVRGAIILSAGFAETAIPEKVQLERDIVTLARRAGIRIVGPNCVGLINADTKLCTSFAPGLRLIKGNLGFITQSGAFGGAFLMLAGDQPEPLGFSKFGHVGNMSDVSNLELFEYFGGDPETSTIGIYLEGVDDGRHLLKLARTVTRQKPVFVLKVGATEVGSQATFSHTGTLAGSDRIYDAAFRQCGMVRVQRMEELLDACKAASMLPRPQGNRVCILTEAGGPGIIALDELGSDGYLQLASLSAETKNRLRETLPPMAAVCKPDGHVDMTAAAMEREHAEALRLILEDPNTDSVVLISLPPTFLPAIDVAEAVTEIARGYGKPVAICFMKGQAMNAARRYLEQRNLPTFDTPDKAVRALVNLTRAADFQRREL